MRTSPLSYLKLGGAKRTLSMNYQSSLKVFVYGTLKPGEINYQHYCRGEVARIPAYTLGNLYALPFGYPAMTVGKNQVRGFLLEFSDRQVLSSLDLLEDYQEQRVVELNLYYRCLTPIYSLDGREIARAWAYYMTRDRILQYRGTKVTSGCWTGLKCS